VYIVKTTKILISLIVTLLIFTQIRISIPFVNNTDEFAPSPGLEGCSVLTCTIGNTTLFGYNLDGYDYLTPFISFGNHLTFSDGGTQYFGKPVAATGRMLPTGPRDGYAEFTLDGLCSAGNSLATVPMYIDPFKTNYTPQIDGPGVVGECNTVEEVIEFFNEHNYIRSDPPEWWWQYHFADAFGKSVVIAVDEEGKVGFTEMNESHYTVSTNHNLLDFSNYDGILYESIQRYDLACEMLDEITIEENLTVDAIRDVLQALSADSTTHSLIMNPRTHDMYVYIPDDYSRTIHFNLEDELASLEVNETKLYNLTALYNDWVPTYTTGESPSSTPHISSEYTTTEISTSTLDTALIADPQLQLVIIGVISGLGIMAISIVVLFVRKRG